MFVAVVLHILVLLIAAVAIWIYCKIDSSVLPINNKFFVFFKSSQK